MAYYEPKNPETGKSPKHQASANKAFGQGVSNTEIAPAINFSEEMYVGYKDSNEFMRIKVEIKNRDGKNEVTMSGNEGEIMKTDDLERQVEDYWNDVDMEEEYGYVADEAIGAEPSDEDIDSYMPDGTPSMKDNEDAYVDAYNIAYDEAMEIHNDKRERYLEGVENDMKSDNYPYEITHEEMVNGEFYSFIMTSCGQVLDSAKNYTPVIPKEDLDFIVKAWESHHLFGFGMSGKNQSAPTTETLQRLIKIHEEYEARGGDSGHIEMMINKLGI